METALHTFEPNLSTEYFNLVLAIFTFWGAGVALYFLFRKKASYEKRNQRQLLQMLTGFVGVIAFGVSLGLLYNLSILQPIKIYSNSVETGYGKVPFDDLKAVYLQQASGRSFVSPDIEIEQTELLYIEEKRGKAYVFSPDNYDVRTIVYTLRPMMDEK